MSPSRSEPLCGTPITLQFVEEKLQNNLSTKASINSFQVQTIGSGLGFMSEIFRIKLMEWSDKEDETLPTSVVIKVPTGAGAKTHFERFTKYMDKEAIESNAGMNWAEFLADSNRKEAEAMLMYETVPDALVPKVYYYECANGNGDVTMMIMQDMSQASAHVNLAHGLTEQQIAVRHGTSYKWEDQSWMEKFMPNKSPDEMQNEMMGFISSMKAITTSLKDTSPELTGLVDRILPHFTMDKFIEGMMSHMTTGMPPVMVHGDLWISNILFEADENNKATSKVHSVFDWATAHPGNGCEDIARLLMSSTKGEMRRKETKNSLRLYRKKFSEVIGEEAPFSEEQLFSAYDACLPSVMMFTVFGVPMWMNIPEIINSPDPAEKERRLQEMVDRARMMMIDYLEVHDT